MNGREEHTIKLENRINEILKDKPSIISNYKYHFGDKTSATKMNYINTVIHFSEYYSGRDVTKLRNTDIRKYLDDIKFITSTDGTRHEISVSTKANKIYALNHFYNYLIDDGYIDKNPCENIKPPKITEEKEIVAMSIEDINHIKKTILAHESGKHMYLVERDLAIFVLGCSTGLRLTAICEINMEDIDFENHTIRVVEKGNKIRNIIIGENVEKVIRCWLYEREELLENDECDALFISNRRQRITQRSVQKLIEKYTQDINKHITPHKMRSTCATYIYENTNDIYRVQDQLGHRRIETSMRYAKMSNVKRQETTKLLDGIWG